MIGVPLRGSVRAAFTLIELLTVIAIIAILAAILIPTASGARTAANKAKTRAQFAQWGAAFEAFKQEYGTYPQFPTAAAQKVVNPTGTSTQVTGNHLFHDVLAGVRRDGSQLNGATTGNPPPAIAQNPRRIRFVNFVDSDFVLAADVAAGRNTNAQLNWIRDAFHNTSIAVITDSNLDGVINGTDTGGTNPTLTVPITGGSVSPSTTLIPNARTGGIHAGVIFYSYLPGATVNSRDTDLIMSWK
ncbi:MAG: prepilin-type N-terminal cleavage/methylation domain-containing protein [Opitutaceae bacterium]